MKKNLRENTKKIWHGISYPKQPKLTWCMTYKGKVAAFVKPTQCTILLTSILNLSTSMKVREQKFI